MKKKPITQVDKSVFLGLIGAQNLHDGVFIAYHRKSDNYPIMAKLDAWPSLQNGGEIADGVLLVQGDRHLVVAPTESEPMNWSSVTKLVGQAITDRVVAMNDWDGKSKTAAILADATIGPDGPTYAPGYFGAYSRSNINGFGLLAGQWWGPSLGEAMFVMANQQKINYALSLITGATQLTTSAIWTVTEISASNAWLLSLGYGHLGYANKVTHSHRCRAVSAYIS